MSGASLNRLTSCNITRCLCQQPEIYYILAPISISRAPVLSPLECATFCHLEGLARCQGYVYDKAAQNCTLAPIYYLHDPESPDPGIVAMVRYGLPMAGTYHSDHSITEKKIIPVEHNFNTLPIKTVSCTSQPYAQPHLAL